MKPMSLKAKIIAALLGIVLAGLAYVKFDIWNTSRQAEQELPSPTEETRP